MTEPQISPDPGKETRIVAVKGRSIVVRKLNEGQLVLMAREAKVLQRDDVDGNRKMSATARLFDILESSVVQEADREYLLDLMTVGDLDLSDLIGFVTIFATDEEKPKVRRGRPARVR